MLEVMFVSEIISTILAEDKIEEVPSEENDKISVHKMQFTVTNRRPKLSAKDKITARREVEKLLFEVFSKHE